MLVTIVEQGLPLMNSLTEDNEFLKISTKTVSRLIYIHIYIYTYTHVCAFVYTYIYTHVCVCAFVDMYTATLYLVNNM